MRIRSGLGCTVGYALETGSFPGPGAGHHPHCVYNLTRLSRFEVSCPSASPATHRPTLLIATNWCLGKQFQFCIFIVYSATLLNQEHFLVDSQGNSKKMTLTFVFSFSIVQLVSFLPFCLETQQSPASKSVSYLIGNGCYVLLLRIMLASGLRYSIFQICFYYKSKSMVRKKKLRKY